MYPLLELHEHGKTNGWLQFVVKRLQIHASSIHFCLKIKCMISKNLPSNINSSHIGKPRSWWKTTLHYQLHPGAHGKIHRTPEGWNQPKVEMLGNHEVYGISSTGNSIHQSGGCGSLRANITFVALQDQPTEALKPQSMTTQGLYGRNILAL